MFQLTKGVEFCSSTEPTTWTCTVILGAIALAILSYSSFTGSAVAANLHSCSDLSKGSIITMISPDTKPIESTIPELIQRQAQAWETADSDKLSLILPKIVYLLFPVLDSGVNSKFKQQQRIILLKLQKLKLPLIP